MKKKSFDLMLWCTFALVGLLCIGIGLGLFLPKATNSNHVKTVGTVIRETNGKTEVQYEAEGKSHTGVLNGRSSAYVPGKEITIYYDRENHNKIDAPGLDVLLLIPVLPGSVFAIMGGIGVGRALSKKRRAARLRETGRKVWARYEGVRVDTCYTVNGRHPYRIYCVWANPADGMEYHFKSEMLWTDPSFRIQERGIEQLAVFLDEKNAKHYYVDTRPLTESLVDLT